MFAKFEKDILAFFVVGKLTIAFLLANFQKRYRIQYAVFSSFLAGCCEASYCNILSCVEFCMKTCVFNVDSGVRKNQDLFFLLFVMR